MKRHDTATSVCSGRKALLLAAGSLLALFSAGCSKPASDVGLTAWYEKCTQFVQNDTSWLRLDGSVDEDSLNKRFREIGLAVFQSAKEMGEAVSQSASSPPARAAAEKLREAARGVAMGKIAQASLGGLVLRPGPAGPDKRVESGRELR